MASIQCKSVSLQLQWQRTATHKTHARIPAEAMGKMEGIGGQVASD
jgi:hypothetical protein